MHRRYRLTGWTAAALAVLLFASVVAQAADVPGIITKAGTGQKLQGMIRWQPASKVYLVTPQGSPVQLKVAARDVGRIQVKKPAQIDQAVQAAMAGRSSVAIPVLKQIADDYLMLQWDVPATEWLARCYLNQKDAKSAAAACEKTLADNSKAGLDPGFAGAYWDALLGVEQFARLRRALADAIKEGPRDLAAVAQVKRGDIDKAQGNLKEALVDGYLRTIVFFEQVKRVQPEALYKAVKCFEELGQHSYAEKMRKKLLAEYPGDPYADKIKSGA